MFFPFIGAHISGAEFQHSDRIWKETSGTMANRVAKSSENKGQLSYLVEAICRDSTIFSRGAGGPRVIGRDIKKRINARRWACVDFLYDYCFFCPNHLSLG